MMLSNVDLPQPDGPTKNDFTHRHIEIYVADSKNRSALSLKRLGDVTKPDHCRGSAGARIAEFLGSKTDNGFSSPTPCYCSWQRLTLGSRPFEVKNHMYVS